MAHFAELNEQNIVTQVIVVSNEVISNLPFPESEPVGIEFCKETFGQNTNWAQTSYSSSFRYNYACVDSVFDPVAQAFIAPKPYPSWLLNTNDYKWTAPVPYPNDGKLYFWDESTLSWSTY